MPSSLRKSSVSVSNCPAGSDRRHQGCRNATGDCGKIKNIPRRNLRRGMSAFIRFVRSFSRETGKAYGERKSRALRIKKATFTRSPTLFLIIAVEKKPGSVSRVASITLILQTASRRRRKIRFQYRVDSGCLLHVRNTDSGRGCQTIQLLHGLLP